MSETNQEPETSSNTGQEQQQNPEKAQQQFDATMRKIAAVLKDSDSPLLKKPGRVSKDALSEVVTELTKERKENNIKIFKADLQELLEKHISFKEEVKRKEEELAKVKREKQQEFVKAANKLFSKIENFSNIEKEWSDSLKSASGTI